MPRLTPDPSFYPSPEMAMAAEPESLAYVAMLNPNPQQPDALAVVDLAPGSSSYGQMVSQVDMPALNTPFYDWAKNVMARRSRPVPPVFEPAVGAAVVAAVSRHPRARTWVGEPTVFAIIGNRVAGGLLDRLAAVFGYRVQQSRAAHEPMRPSDLYESVPADVAARGSFGRESVTWSPQVWAVTHRRAASVLSLATAATAISAIVRRSR